MLGGLDLALASVGGESLEGVLALLDQHGVAVTFGASGQSPTTFEARPFYLGGQHLEGFLIFQEVDAKPASQGLQRLSHLLAAGKLHPRIAVEAPWTAIAQVAQQLMDRTYPGKAVLHVTQQ